MSILTATKSGVWSDTTVWGGSVPSVADTARCAGYTIIVDVTTIAAVALEARAANGTDAVGGFQITEAAGVFTINASIVGGLGAAGCLRTAGAVGQAVTIAINGSVTPGSGGPGIGAVQTTSSLTVSGGVVYSHSSQVAINTGSSAPVTVASSDIIVTAGHRWPIVAALAFEPSTGNYIQIGATVLAVCNLNNVVNLGVPNRWPFK
jgi:hypothetical protein